MELRYLSEEFFKTYKDCPELMQKGTRPYVILVIQTETMKFAIPIITDSWLKENDYPVINEYESNYIKFDESKIRYQYTVFLNAFKKDITRRKKNSNIPENKDFQFCTLKYFLKELGL